MAWLKKHSWWVNFLKYSPEICPFLDLWIIQDGILLFINNQLLIFLYFSSVLVYLKVTSESYIHEINRWIYYASKYVRVTKLYDGFWKIITKLSLWVPFKYFTREIMHSLFTVVLRFKLYVWRFFVVNYKGPACAYLFWPIIIFLRIYGCIEIFTYMLFVNGHFFAKIRLLKDWDINSRLLAGASRFNIIFMDTCATILCVKAQYVPIPFIYCAAPDPLGFSKTCCIQGGGVQTPLLKNHQIHWWSSSLDGVSRRCCDNSCPFSRAFSSAYVLLINILSCPLTEMSGAP